MFREITFTQFNICKMLRKCLAPSNSIEVLAIIIILDDKADEDGSMHYKHIFTSTSVIQMSCKNLDRSAMTYGC